MITTTLEATLLILTIEFSLLAIGITYFTFRGARSVESKSNAQATELVSKVSATADERRSALQTVFREKYQIDEASLETTVDEFMEREKAFYNAVVGVFLGRGDHKISDLNDELTKVVAPWISITPNNLVASAVVDSIAAEKSQVEAELDDTKKVLEKMIDEYNRAFRLSPEAENPSTVVADNDAPSVERDEALLSISLDDDDTEEVVAQDGLAGSSETFANQGDPKTSDGTPDNEGIDLSAIEQLTEDVEFATEIPGSGTQPDPDIENQSNSESASDPSQEMMSAEDLDELMDGLEAESSPELESV
ncbi:MAG: hypothetical protein O3C28_09795 [Proteobacteria bacterium]|nr:hypothetical protein [Pseudomonadota bacterium]